MLAAIYFGLYGASVVLYPDSYSEFLGHGALFFFVIGGLIASALLLLLDRFLVAAVIYIFGFMTVVESVYFCNSEQLDWTYLGWVLAAFFMLKIGASRTLVIEIGWLLGGLTFFLQGVAKLVLTGHDWLTGKVIMSLIFWSSPTVFKTLYDTGVLVPLAIGLSALAVIFHLSALPLALFRKGRRYLWIMAIVFHSILIFSPFYFVSIGLLAFWFFLGQFFEVAETQPV